MIKPGVWAMRVRCLLQVSVAIAFSSFTAIVSFAQTDFEGAPIHYLTAEVNDPISQLAAFVDNSSEPHDLESGANVLLLEGIVATKPYLSPHSDLVALMVLEHQTQMHNAIAAANYETRAAIHQSYQMNELLDREEGHISDSANRRIDAVAARVVRYLLMCDEFALKDPVSGTSEFAKEFQARGTRDTASPDKILEILMATKPDLFPTNRTTDLNERR